MTKTKNQKARAKAQKKQVSGVTQNSSKPQQKGRVQTVYKNVQLSISVHSFNYLRSVLFPSSGPVRIPDACQLSTSVYNCSYDFNQVPNAQGCLGFKITLNSVPTFTPESSTSASNGFVYSGYSIVPAAASINASFSAVRLASAAIHGYSTTSSLSDQGQIMGWTQAVGSGGTDLELAPTQSSSVAAMRDNWTFPSKEGIFIRYKATDSSSFFFSPTGYITTNPTYVGTNRGTLGVHMEGLASTATFRFRLIVNYECLPAGDLLSYQNVEQSKYDGPGFDVVKGIIGAVPSFMDYHTAEKYISQGLQVANQANQAYQFARRLVAAYGATIRN